MSKLNSFSNVSVTMNSTKDIQYNISLHMVDYSLSIL
jgi:hypothetical protein